ncbi:MAG: hypothetical protein GY915_09265, partial [bacterium]|nr:hypothetical protein [bacterium]
MLNAGEHKRVLTPEQETFRDTIADWLNKYPWLLLWTVTYDRMEQRLSQNYTKTGHWKGRPQQIGISESNTKKYFEKHMQKHYAEWSWFYVVEPNPSRDGHHLHALLIPPTGVDFSFKDMGAKWWDQYGWNQVEYIESKKDVSSYCTKHVVRYLNKGGGWYNID